MHVVDTVSAEEGIRRPTYMIPFANSHNMPKKNSCVTFIKHFSLHILYGLSLKPDILLKDKTVEKKDNSCHQPRPTMMNYLFWGGGSSPLKREKKILK